MFSLTKKFECDVKDYIHKLDNRTQNIIKYMNNLNKYIISLKDIKGVSFHILPIYHEITIDKGDFTEEELKKYNIEDINKKDLYCVITRISDGVYVVDGTNIRLTVEGGPLFNSEQEMFNYYKNNPLLINERKIDDLNIYNMEKISEINIKEIDYVLSRLVKIGIDYVKEYFNGTYLDYAKEQAYSENEIYNFASEIKKMLKNN